jgi:hypothetical protein
MPPIERPALPNEVRPTAAWATALLAALVREERTGRRPARLTEPGLETWRRFRGRLGALDLLSIVFEDAAVLHPIPFDPDRLGADLHLDRLPVALVESWLEALQAPADRTDGAEHVIEQARLLDLPTRLGRSDLNVVKAHHRLLELPGTGGQLAHHLVSTLPDLTLQGNFTLACGSWQELTLAGVIALDLQAPHTDFILPVDPAALRGDPAHPLRARHRSAPFDFVVGLHPDKGGRYRQEDELTLWFGPARVLLV